MMSWKFGIIQTPFPFFHTKLAVLLTYAWFVLLTRSVLLTRYVLLTHSIVIYYYDITINTGYTYKSIVEDPVRCL